MKMPQNMMRALNQAVAGAMSDMSRSDARRKEFEEWAKATFPNAPLIVASADGTTKKAYHTEPRLAWDLTDKSYNDNKRFGFGEYGGGFGIRWLYKMSEEYKTKYLDLKLQEKEIWKQLQQCKLDAMKYGTPLTLKEANEYLVPAKAKRTDLYCKYSPQWCQDNCKVHKVNT